jgi:hypothetical protein
MYFPVLLNRHSAHVTVASTADRPQVGDVVTTAFCFRSVMADLKIAVMNRAYSATIALSLCLVSHVLHPNIVPQAFTDFLPLCRRGFLAEQTAFGHREKGLYHESNCMVADLSFAWELF